MPEEYDNEKNSAENTGSSENKENNTNKKSKSSTKNSVKFTKADEFEFTLYNKNLNNPIELLEKLYPLKDDETLTTAEKNKRIQKIMKEYME